MSNKAYDIIRFLSEVLITAIGALYWALADTWGLPYGEQIVATCAAVSTFLGVFVHWQRSVYNKQNNISNDLDKINPEAEEQINGI